MNKYIATNKLIAAIEKLKNELKSLMNKIYYAANYKEWEAELSGYNKILRLITVLQQEQPEPSNNLVDVDAVREDFMAEVYRILDADSTNDRANAIIDAFDSLPTISQGQPEADKYDRPTTPIEEAVEVTSRMQHIDEEMKPIAKFIMDYASWNLHKDEWNQPVIEVPLFRVLDALAQKGKPYCDAN